MEFQNPVFHVAASGDAAALEQMFLNDPQLINEPDFDGNMPLHWAALSGSTPAVQVCLDALSRRGDLDVETEVQRQNFMNQDAMCCAATKGNLESVRLLLSFGARTDYRYSNTVPVLIEALHSSNVELTRFLLGTLEVDFNRSRNDQYWFEALKPNLTISLELFKILKANAVPYDVSDFYEMCLILFEFEVESPGLEDFLVYLCTDAVDRWTANNELVVKGIRRISSFFLRKLVPYSGSFDCVHRLQRLGVFEPPVSARGWLRVLTEWGLSPQQLSSAVNQDRVLLDLIGPLQQSNFSQSKTVVRDPSLLPLVLYFAVLALKFPNSNWLSDWETRSAQFNPSDCEISTLFELHTVRHSRSGSDFFWYDLFPFVCCRAVYVFSCDDLSLEIIKSQLDVLLEHMFQNFPATHPTQMVTQGSLFLNLVSSFPASSKVPGHMLFLYTLRRHILPWLPPVGWELVRSGGLLTATVHVLSNPPLLECILDFSPLLARYLISNVDDWPEQIRLNPEPLIEYLITSYCESRLAIQVPEDPIELLFPGVSGNSSRIPLNLLEHRLAVIQAEPYTLQTLTKIHLRLHLRRSQLSFRSQSSILQPISQLIQRLPIPLAIQEWLIV